MRKEASQVGNYIVLWGSASERFVIQSFLQSMCSSIVHRKGQ